MSDERARSSIDQWISEYPTYRQMILANQNLFAAGPPPTGNEVSTREWMALIASLYGSEKSTGDQSSDT